MQATPTRSFTLSANLGTEDAPLKVDIDRDQICIEADGGKLTGKDTDRHYVNLTFEQFEAVAREFNYFISLKKEAA